MVETLDEAAWQRIQQAITAEAERVGQTRAEWWLRHLFMLVDERKNPPVSVQFSPSPVQTGIMADLHYLTNILKARQHGCSSLIALLMAYFVQATADYKAGIIDRTDQEARKKLLKVRYAWEHMDDPALGPISQLGAAIKAANPLVIDNERELKWANGSTIYAATSLRGGTINFLWISELGKIAMDDPRKAEEIMQGSLESVHPGNLCVIESTHEGGRYGENYRMIRLAERSPENPSVMQWKLLFYGWQDNPEYAMPLGPGESLNVPLALVRYFENLEKATGNLLSDAQKNWYVQKAAFQLDMARQYPGTVEEALQAQTRGSIYGEAVSLLRANGRIHDFEHDRVAQFYVFWDIGISDFTCAWLLQFVQLDILALDYHTGNGMTPAEHMVKMIEWERYYGKPITMHYMPHDADQRGISGKTARDLYKEAGMRDVKVVPRTPNIWVGINGLRALLPKFRFHATNCERDFKQANGSLLPSGLGALEGYNRKYESIGGQVSEVPMHNDASHGASALRTFSEAHAKGMLDGPSRGAVESRRNAGRGPPGAITGLSKGRANQLRGR